MRPVFLSILFFSCFSVCVVAQCADPIAYKPGGELATEKISFKAPTEVSLAIRATSFKTSWAKKGAEAAVVSIFVDGKYSQDLMVFTGEENLVAEKARRQESRVSLGELPAGEHKIEAFLNKERSAPGANYVATADMSVLWSSLGDYSMFRDVPKTSREYVSYEGFRAQFMARANSPVIYARPNTVDKFSDIPLLTYYELFDEPNGVTLIRYSVIFTNEDGGTQSKALMARWGRMTDIEWVYEMRIDKDGKVIDEIYQAANHVTKKFEGKRILGSHPVIYDATDNNNFADTGCSSLRFANEAVEADLSHGSRETMQERFPWIYRVMSEEAIREGRVVPGDKGANTIGDPRNYLYAEVYNEPKDAAVAVEAKLTNGETIVSDLGVPQMRVDRPGYARIAFELPAKKAFDDIESFSIWCHAKTPGVYSECKGVKLVKVITLDENYLPVQHPINMEPQTLTDGESAYHSMKKSDPANPKKKLTVYKPG